MNNKNTATEWLEQHNIKFVELIVADMAGTPRGKILPVEEFGEAKKKMPWSILSQTVTGDYYYPESNIKDGDLEIRPDFSTMKIVPWATEPTASVLVDCFELASGEEVEVAPRAVLRRVLEKYEEQGWFPVVAPEVEFYLTVPDENISTDADVYDPERDDLEKLVNPYGFDYVNEHGTFFKMLSDCCDEQNISIGAVSQELGPSQFEINFPHGSPLQLADDVFQFKRALKNIANEYGIHATLMAKPNAEHAGSALHIHQSVVDKDQQNIFSTPEGEPSAFFHHYLGGLQKYTPASLLLMAPFANSYRRFLSYYSSPMNLEWGIDNRTAGFRVPDSNASARRIENRLAGSDANPYLVLAATLACGYLGMMNKIEAKPAVQDSAYDVPFALHRHVYEAIDSLRESTELQELLGNEFVEIYTAVKELEQREHQARIPDWEVSQMMYLI